MHSFTYCKSLQGKRKLTRYSPTRPSTVPLPSLLLHRQTQADRRKLHMFPPGSLPFFPPCVLPAHFLPDTYTHSLSFSSSSPLSKLHSLYFLSPHSTSGALLPPFRSFFPFPSCCSLRGEASRHLYVSSCSLSLLSVIRPLPFRQHPSGQKLHPSS